MRVVLGMTNVNAARAALWSWEHTVKVDPSIRGAISKAEVEASGRYELQWPDGSSSLPLLGYYAEIGPDHRTYVFRGDVSGMNPDEQARVRPLPSHW